MKLHNYDVVVMGNTGFKFQLDLIHGLAARIIYIFLNKTHLIGCAWMGLRVEK